MIPDLQRRAALELIVLNLLLIEIARNPSFPSTLRQSFDVALGLSIGDPLYDDVQAVADVRKIFMEMLDLAQANAPKRQLTLRRRFLNWLQAG